VIINIVTYMGPFPVFGSFNPVAGTIDTDGAQTHRLASQGVVEPFSGSAPVAQAGHYTHPLSLVDWVVSGGFATATITSATHGLGAGVKDITLYEGNTIVGAEVTVTPSGDVDVRVPSGFQFVGSVVIG